MFLIIKYFESFSLKVPGIPDAWPRWAKVSVGSIKEGNKTIPRVRFKLLDRVAAKKLIEENGLVESHRDRNGLVYDTPDRSFYKKYHKALSIPRSLGAE